MHQRDLQDNIGDDQTKPRGQAKIGMWHVINCLCQADFHLNVPETSYWILDYEFVLNLTLRFDACITHVFVYNFINTILSSGEVFVFSVFTVAKFSGFVNLK